MTKSFVLSAAMLLLALSQLRLAAHAQESSCGSLPASELIQRRKESLRLNLIAQLGISEETEVNAQPNATAAPPSNATIEEYEALVNASKSIEENSEKKCISEDFYAKPVTLFSGAMFLDESVPLSLTKRQAQEGEPKPTAFDKSIASEQSSLLASYHIQLENFQLSSELSEVTQADLLIYQLPTLTSADIDVRDIEQFVEIRTLLQPLGERHVVEGKYLNLFGSGYKVFDITPAVRLWLLKGIQGNVTLEIVVYCYSSPKCASRLNGTTPAVIRFDHKTGVDQTSETQPKVVILSRNPLEVAERARRRKRQAQTTPTKFCKANETICCLKPLVLNFRRDLGMDFITQPDSFEANFCEGYCPELSGEDVMTSTRFQFLRRLNNSPASSIEPCCSGSEYRNLDVLMTKYKQNLERYVTVIERLEQVTVTKCKCA